jgi:8-oxo-dGTP pyrophosphatase MutT (NUDIX family)
MSFFCLKRQIASAEHPVTEISWQHEEGNDHALESNWLFQLKRERFRSRRTGKVHDFYVMHLADAVQVIALTTERQLVLVRQFRVGARRDTLETPGGLLDAGEDPLEAGARELLEETGYAGESPQPLCTVWSNPSLLTTKITTILITGARRVADPRLDPGEEVEVELVDVDRVPTMLENGEIEHAHVVVGLLWWLRLGGSEEAHRARAKAADRD